MRIRTGMDMSEPTRKAWHRLDNAAKIFPPTSEKADTKVFRFTCELFEDVEEKLLQSALDLAIEDFPDFRCVLKRGMFWYYLEQSNLKPIVREEDSPPCSTVYIGRKSLLFEVTWYSRRINLEIYHALTDGTGALQFLKTLTLYYLKLAHPEEMKDAGGIDYDASNTQKTADSFHKYYDKSKDKVRLKNPAAYQLRGAKEAEWRLKIIEGTFPADKILNKAREHNATATVFITSLLMLSIYEEMSVQERKKPVVITIPVDLRNYFDSKSTRNFFSIIHAKYDFRNYGNTIEEIINGVKASFNEQLNEKYLQSRLNSLLKWERNIFIRVAPLAFKNLCMRIAGFMAGRASTAAISNLGKINMPEQAKAYIRLFDVFYTTKKLQICMCTYGKNMNISFTSPFLSADIQRNFFRKLTKMGIEVEITANNLNKNYTQINRRGKQPNENV